MHKTNTIFKSKEFIQFIRMAFLLTLICYLIFRVTDSLGFFIEEIKCGAEQVVKKDSTERLVSSGGYLFDNINGRTNEKSFEGSWSIKLTPENGFGMAIKLDIPPDKEEMEATVWRFIDKVSADTSKYAFIVASIGNTFWKGSCVGEETKNGWEKLHIRFTVPKGNYHEPLSFYCWNNTKNIVYFDNMTIKRKNYWKFFKQ